MEIEYLSALKKPEDTIDLYKSLEWYRLPGYTDEDIAKYSILHGNEQLFASKYKLYLPTEEELRAEIENQKTMFYLQQQENDE